MREGEVSNEPSQGRTEHGFQTLSQGACDCKQKRLWVHVSGRMCVCWCMSMCQSVCGSGSNRWEVCRVLVNKSVIVLLCPAWLTVSCAGSSSFPLNPRTLTRQPRMPAHTQIQGHTQSCEHKQILLGISWCPVIELGHHQWYFRFGGLMHPSEEASALFFPATELFEPAASVRHGLRGSHAHTHTLPAETNSFPKSLTNGAPGRSRRCNTTQQQYSLNCLAVYFLKEVKSPT